MVDVVRKSAVIAGNGDKLLLDAAGMSSGVLSVDGTFDGEIEVVGIVSGATAEGGRLLFQSGVGALGDNVVKGAGAATSREFRIVVGGDRVILRGKNWVSGSATVNLVCKRDPSTIFINGPVHGAFEQAVRVGRAYSVGAGDVQVLNGEFLNITFVNPSDSGRNAFMQIRSFQQDAAEALVLHIVSNPDPITGTLLTPLNLKGGSPASDMEFRYEVDTTALTGEAVGAGAFIPTNGIPYDIDADIFLREVIPGEAFGFYIGGIGNSPAQASNISVIFSHYEEDI